VAGTSGHAPHATTPLDSLVTGIRGLDLVLGGGVPAGDTLLVVGEAGSGKTTLALQTAFHLAAEGRNTCFASTTSESPSKLLAHARTFAFFDERVVGKRISLLSIHPLIEDGLRAVREALEKEVVATGAALLVLDGLMTLYALHPEPRELRAFVYELQSMLAAFRCTLLITSSRTEPGAMHEYAEFTMADALLRLSHPLVGTRGHRTARVVKVRGRAPLPGLHTCRLDGAGLALFPRFETLERGGERRPTDDRMPSGLAGFDEMISGGFPEGSVTAVAGAVGTGKTLFGLHFLLEGVRRGERGLLVSLRETRGELVHKARRLGMDLETPLGRGDVVFHHRSPVDLPVDEAMHELDAVIEGAACRRFVLDGIQELADPVGDELRRFNLLFVLSTLVGSRGITAVVPLQVAGVVGPELDLGRTPIAALAHNVVLLRPAEYRGRLYRVLSILKARDSGFDPGIRRYAVTGEGLRVLDPAAEGEEDVLAGIAGLGSEARVKRTPRPEAGA
jgi:circadian clock protein KaiC